MKVGLISTMPRSGTWYIRYFFHFYHHLLLLLDQDNISVTETNLWKILQKHIQNYNNIINDLKLFVYDRNNTIGLDVMGILHAMCPGFSRYQGKYRKFWDELTFPDMGYDQSQGFVEYIRRGRFRVPVDHLFSPTLNENVRIAYFYRNPLDQAVSSFNHIQNHKTQGHRYYIDHQGNMTLMSNVSEFIHHVGLEAYIKQFLTFKIMKDLYSDNILLLKYENLVRNPKSTFLSVLKHFGHDVEDSNHLKKVEMALLLSSKKSLKKIEKIIGHSLGEDQIDPNQSHIRDGSVGKWRTHLGKDDLAKIQERLERFGLSLTDFDVC